MLPRMCMQGAPTGKGVFVGTTYVGNIYLGNMCVGGLGSYVCVGRLLSRECGHESVHV